jgi:protein-S-isoprenylcysteine O-methyltransferase Ste14
MEVDKVLAKWRIRLGQLFILGFAAVILFTGSYWEENNIVGGILFLIGTILASIAAVGRMWCSVYISGYKKDLLVTTGPYSMCRNPLYFFSLTGAVGVGLATKTFLIPFIIFILFAVYYPLVIRREEARLTRIHKNDFEDYREKTPRFIPSFSNFEEPEEYTIKPGFLRGRFTDSLWFVWLIGILALVESLHRHGVVPVYYRLY